MFLKEDIFNNLFLVFWGKSDCGIIVMGCTNVKFNIVDNAPGLVVNLTNVFKISFYPWFFKSIMKFKIELERHSLNFFKLVGHATIVSVNISQSFLCLKWLVDLNDALKPSNLMAVESNWCQNQNKEKHCETDYLFPNVHVHGILKSKSLSWHELENTCHHSPISRVASGSLRLWVMALRCIDFGGPRLN